MSERAQALLERYIDHLLVEDERLDPAQLCAEAPELLEPLRALIARYESIEQDLAALPHAIPGPAAPEPLPQIPGFRTVERLGRGGMGEVYKLEDLSLGRTVAGKILRADARVAQGLPGFVREASTLALFEDPRIVRIYELRGDTAPPMIIMEYVEGFELGAVAPSLEYPQRARILAEVCQAVHKAHSLGVQHRDLKPSNIMLDQQLGPKVLDFGLAGSEPHQGHGLGTLPYMAPEQLDPQQPIDARADVHALGAIFYEVLCGVPPDQHQPRLPVEIQPDVPEPLQAIALKAMEPRPADRYPDAGEMALELRRYLDGRPVLARPTSYNSALGRRILPHLEDIQEWLRLKLVYGHEAARLRAVYRRLELRNDDWIVQSRQLSLSRIALYLGSFVLACGAFLYLAAHRFFGAETGWFAPMAVLGLPFLLLNTTAHLLYRRQHQAVAVAFGLGSVALLPLLTLITMAELGLGTVDPQTPGQLFSSGAISNSQLQLATLLGAGWSLLLAVRTRTTVLGTVFTVTVLLFALALFTDLGLPDWLSLERYDLLALHLSPLVLIASLAGHRAEVHGQPWLSLPTWLAAALLLVLCLELLALDGRSFHYLGISMVGAQPDGLSDPLLLDTLAAMTVNGALIYLAAALADRHGSEGVRPAAQLLFSLAPFAILEPLAWLVITGDYSQNYDWLYLATALAIAFLSHHRQRRSFYYAGLFNTGTALVLISQHREWFDAPSWAAAVLLGGLGILAAGAGLDRYERWQSIPRER